MCNFFFTAGQTGEHRVELPSKSNEETTQRRLFIVLSVGRTKNGGGGWMGYMALHLHLHKDGFNICNRSLSDLEEV